MQNGLGPALPPPRGGTWLSLSLVLALAAGCGGPGAKDGKKRFFTSGSREADQRAEQRMAKADQLNGDEPEGKGGTTETANKEENATLYERLGGEPGLTRIVDDFVARALQDPRVNWSREGVGPTGLLARWNRVEPWQATEQNVARLKKHMVQFFSLATGGPPRYEGKEMKAAHAGMQIENSQFDAAVGDLKASLDRLQVGEKEQKQLLAIVESTRPQVVTQR